MVEIALSEKLISGPDVVKSCRDFCSRDKILQAESSVISGHKNAPRFLKS